MNRLDAGHENGTSRLNLPSRDSIADSYLLSLEQHYRAQTMRLRADIDNLLANSVGIDDHARIDNALAELFQQLANEQDVLESIERYRDSRSSK